MTGPIEIGARKTNVLVPIVGAVDGVPPEVSGALPLYLRDFEPGRYRLVLNLMEGPTHTLSNPTGGATLGTPSTAVLIIIDNDSGLRGEYFDNADLTNLKLTRVDPMIDFDYGKGAPPDTLLGANTFSIRWTGKLKTDVTETYTFDLETDDGVRLWIDGHLVVDHWQTGRSINTRMIDLTAGLHDIKIEFFEDTDEALARLKWSSSSRSERVIIPQDHLSPSEAVGAAPQLAWTEEPGYCSSGLEPEIGNTHTSFTYRVKYTDVNGDAPTALSSSFRGMGASPQTSGLL